MLQESGKVEQTSPSSSTAFSTGDSSRADSNMSNTTAATLRKQFSIKAPTMESIVEEMDASIDHDIGDSGPGLQVLCICI